MLHSFPDVHSPIGALLSVFWNRASLGLFDFAVCLQLCKARGGAGGSSSWEEGLTTVRGRYRVDTRKGGVEMLELQLVVLVEYGVKFGSSASSIVTLVVLTLQRTTNRRVNQRRCVVALELTLLHNCSRCRRVAMNYSTERLPSERWVSMALTNHSSRMALLRTMVQVTYTPRAWFLRDL